MHALPSRPLPTLPAAARGEVPDTAVKTLADILWTLVRWTLPVTLAGLVVAGAFGTGRIGEEVRRRIELRLRAEFPDLAVQVQAASLVDGEGIVARGVAIVDPALPPQYRQLVWIEEVRLACSTSLADLASGEPRITSVHVRRPLVHAYRGPNATWSLAKLARSGTGTHAVPVTIEDATVLVEDARLRNRVTLRQLGLELQPEPDGMAGLRGSVAGDFFERVDVSGTLNVAQGSFAVTGKVVSLEISPRLLAAVPVADSLRRSIAGLSGRVDLAWRCAGLLADLERADFAASGRMESGRVEHPALPFAVSDVAAQFTVDRSGLVCERLQAHSGSTLLRGSGRMHGWDVAADFDVSLAADRLIVGRHWEGLLPESVAPHWSRLLPAGEVDCTARIVRQAGVIQPDVKVFCRNVSLTYYRFPYRVDHTVGTVTYKGSGPGSTLAMHLKGKAGGHDVTVEGTISRQADGSHGFVEVCGEGMQIDDTLLAAMPARSADIIRSLRGSGTFGFVFRHDRSPQHPGGHVNSLTIRLARCSMAYAGFAYPLSNVSGIIRMAGGKWTIHDVVGSNDTGVVRCSGSLEPLPDNDGELTLRLSGSGVVLERELRDALPAGMRRIWDDIDPQGNADFAATVRHRVKARRTEVSLDATPVGDTVSIEPAGFAYRLEKLRGRLTWRDGTLRFEEMRGVHDRTTVSAHGTCQFAGDGGWRVSFTRLSADRFRADHDVLSALPAGLREAVTGVRLRGLLALDGGLDIYTTAPVLVTHADGRQELVPGPVAAAWDMHLDMEQGSMDVGMPLEHVHGGIRIRGQSDGRTWRTVGDVAFDSAMWRGVQLTALRGPLLMDPGGVRLGAPAAGEPGSARRFSARVAGGTLLVDATVAAAAPGTFAVSVTLGEADLERLAGDLSGGPQRYRGRVFGGVEVTGSRAGTHSLAGRGQVRLRDADIYELPVIVALLKILRIKAPDRNAFSSSVVDFRIEGPHAYLDNIELSGDAISLVGAGEIDFDSNLHLTFRSIMGDSASQLPAMKRVLGGASGQFLLVHVDGTLAEPVTTTEAFPTLAAAVQRFQAQQRQGTRLERMAGQRDPPR